MPGDGDMRLLLPSHANCLVLPRYSLPERCGRSDITWLSEDPAPGRGIHPRYNPIQLPLAEINPALAPHVDPGFLAI